MFTTRLMILMLLITVALGAACGTTETDWTKHVKEQQQRLSMMSCKMFLEIGAGDCTFLDGIKTDAVKMAVDPCEAVERAAEFGIAYKRAPFSV
jgi:thioredoxin-related protein